MTQTLKSTVAVDDLSASLAEQFDYAFDGTVKTSVPSFELPQDDFNIGLIVGASGSGKSTILSSLGNQEETTSWYHDKPVASHFETKEEALAKFSAVGFNSVPSWFKPYHVLSNGEQFRVNLARRLQDGARFDEFTSVVDRNVAKSCSHALQKHVRKEDLKGLVFASCHRDIIEWLQPDWVFDTDRGELLPRGSLRRPNINLELLPCGYDTWTIFAKHHYLTGKLNKSAKHWMCLWEDTLVGFVSAIPMPSGTLKNAFRGHRTVVLPDFQGLGIGMAMSAAVGEMHIEEGKRYFSKTTHPKMGQHRNNSKLWKATSKNMRARHAESQHTNMGEIRRVFAYSHEYIGEQ